MNAKKGISAVLLLLASVCAQAQGSFVIEGNVKNVKQGVCLNLFRMEGNAGRSCAVDTLCGDSFRFEVPVSEDIARLSLGIRDGNMYYPMQLKLWAKAGSYIRVTGNDANIYTWKVESELPQQQVHEIFVNDSRGLWNLYQANLMELYRLRSKYRQKPIDEAEAARVVALRDSLEKVSLELKNRINSNVIARMRQLPVEEVWMDNLQTLSIGVRYTEGFPYRKEVEELYAGLTDEQRQTPEALDVKANLFPDKLVAVGEKAADGDLFDLQGNVHHLSDFKGKAVLIDFWSSSCGPCIMALPEMKEISQKYEDRLVVVSISTDVKNAWKSASQRHDISWWNLNDLKGNHGIYAKYSSGAIPRYVFLSPEGKVVEMWSGYGKGSLLEKMGKLME